MAASDQTNADMDGDQYTTGEGPCVDASEQGRWFHAKSLDTETRWPSFTPKAHGLGMHAILSSPLLVAERPVGALIPRRVVAALLRGYFELGGMSTAIDVEAHLYGALLPSDHDHDVLAHALNERFTECGGDHPVPYNSEPT